VTAEAIQLRPILECAQASGGLSFNVDVRPTLDQQVLFHHQSLINVIEILVKYAAAFEPKTKLTELQHKVHQQMPQDYVTKQYPLQVSTIDKLSTMAQPKVLHNIYINQMKMKSKDLEHIAIPSFQV
jgi:hypothetical protein